MVTLSLNFMILYCRQFGARVSPLACWRCLPLAQFGALFPSFLPSVSPRVAEDYSTVIGVALGDNSMPALFFHMDDVSGRVGGFWGLGLGLDVF